MYEAGTARFTRASKEMRSGVKHVVKLKKEEISTEAIAFVEGPYARGAGRPESADGVAPLAHRLQLRMALLSCRLLIRASYFSHWRHTPSISRS